MKSKKKQKSAMKEAPKASEKYGPLSKKDLKAWDKYMRHVPSLPPPKWIQMGMTKEEWEKQGSPKRRKGKK